MVKFLGVYVNCFLSFKPHEFPHHLPVFNVAPGLTHFFPQMLYFIMLFIFP